MDMLKPVFWVSLGVVFYSYIGYGIFLWVMVQIRSLFQRQPNDNKPAFFEPGVTMVVATYNEELFVRDKIQNLFELDYPKDKFRIIFVADGSTDKTPDIIREYPSVQLLYESERKGKVAAINRAMEYVKTDYVIFCDANTMLNKSAVREIVKHYANEWVGGVSGEKKVVDLSKEENVAGAGEGLYWKYESWLKNLDSKFYTVVGAAGELFSIRTSLYEHVDNNILLDDFIISLRICKKGYKVVYEPSAYAQEAPSLTMKDEQKRKIRISAGAFQSIVLLKDLFNIFKYGRLSFQYISHRVLRWVFCPVLLPVALITNVLITLSNNDRLYTYLLICQGLFYAGALIGWLFALAGKKVKLLYIPYYFLFMNLALYIGFARFISNKQSVLWEKAKRKI